QVLDQPRLVRSADMSLGVQATRAIQFVNQSVPEEAVILLPPEGVPGRFALERSMQYFFFPRRLIECGSVENERCSQALASPEVYILATEDFPAQPIAQGREFLPAPSTGLDWFTGIYGPAFDWPSAAQPARQPAVLVAAFEDLGLVVALSVLGAAVLLSFRRPWPALEALCLAFPLGAGILTWMVFLLSWAGITLSLLSVGAAYLILLAGFATLARRTRPLGRAIEWSMAELRGSAPRLLLAGAAVGVLCLAVGLALGISYRLFDPVQIWSVKGYGISLEGTIRAAETWGVHGLSYPLNLPLQIALFHLLDGDLLPGSKLLYPIYGLSLCLALFTFLRRQRVDWLAAGLGALLLGTVPIVFFHSVEGFANLHFTFYLTAGILWGVQGVHSSSVREQWLAGLLLGLAAWTRPEGIVYSLGALLVFMVAVRINKQGRASMAALGVPVVVLAGAWFAFTLGGEFLRGSQQDQVASAAASTILAGGIDLGGLWIIFKTFSRAAIIPFRAMFPSTSATAWGALFPVVLVLLAAGLRHLSPRHNPARFTLLLQWLFVGGTNVSIFYLQSYSFPNFTAFIERAFPRASLPTAVLMTVLAVWVVDGTARRDTTDSL
ncbi:MAG TPA: hypothetical protein VGA07_09425, partial [Anaerolineales bacterium]